MSGPVVRRGAVLSILATVLLATGPAAVAAPGSFDQSFGRSGYVATRVGTPLANAIAVRRDVVVGGASGHSLELVRYLTDGRLDTAFGVRGRVAKTFARPVALASVALQDNGKVVALLRLGFDHVTTILLRLTAEGRLDHTFGGDGRVDLSGFTGEGLTIDHHDRLLVAGSTDGFAVARLLPSGRLDPTFRGGIATAKFPDGAEADAVMVRRDGRLLVAGTTVIGGCSGGGCSTPFLLAQFRPGGFLDRSFGHLGRIRGEDMGCTCVVKAGLAPDGSVFLGANETLARYGPHGFKVWSEILFLPGDYSETIRDVASDRFGNALVVANGGYDFRGRLWRFTAEGKPDRSFGDGTAHAPLPRVYPKSSLAAEALQSDGRVVAAGVACSGRWLVARYLDR